MTGFVWNSLVYFYLGQETLGSLVLLFCFFFKGTKNNVQTL